MDEWIFFTPNSLDIYKLIIYDDGNEKYEQYENMWLISGQWNGKVELINRTNSEIKINSISKWKIMNQCEF